MTMFVESRKHYIDLQGQRIKRLKHRARHTQTFWTNPRTWLLTLTYKPTVDAEKEHWTQALTKFRKWYRRVHCQEPQILWVREQTKRGRLHYHAVINGEYPGKWDRLGFWPHGMSQIKKGDGAACTNYLLKYASKLDSKLGGGYKHWRLYGFVGLTQAQRKTISYQMLPEWIRATYAPELVQSACRRVLVSGQRLYSGFVRVGTNGQVRGLDVFAFLGYCPLVASIHYQHHGGGRERSAPRVVGLVS